MLLFYKRRRKIQFTFLPLLVLFQYMEKKRKKIESNVGAVGRADRANCAARPCGFLFSVFTKKSPDGSCDPPKPFFQKRGHRLPRRKAIFSMWHHFKSCSLNFHEGNISMGGGVLLPAYLPLTTRVPFILIQTIDGSILTLYWMIVTIGFFTHMGAAPFYMVALMVVLVAPPMINWCSDLHQANRYFKNYLSDGFIYPFYLL